MSYKRPFHDEVPYEVGCKHPRQEGQEGHTAPQSPTLRTACCGDCSQKHFSDEGQNNGGKSQRERMIKRNIICAEVDGANEGLEVVNTSGSTSSYLLINGNAIDEYAEPEATIHLSFFSHFFEIEHQVTSQVQPRDIYSLLLEQPPRKLVSVGPDYQADIPELVPKDFSKLLSCMVDDDDKGAEKVGTSVIAMPDIESPPNSLVKQGFRGYCNCADQGSIRCVRQHVIEMREELKENLGKSLFEELGFCDMGEEVAKKWTEDEEQTFHEVVLLNPASQGKNFWHHLSAVFPSRTKRDVVSYYFNVFVLRKRAEQNRFDPLTIDSDNDEWHISEVEMSEEDDDSGVESVDEDAPAHDQENHEDNLRKGIGEDGGRNSCKDERDSANSRYVVGEEEEGDIDDVFASVIGNSSGDFGLGPVFQLRGKISSGNGDDHGFQDDSCTSYEFHNTKIESDVPVDFRTDERESI